MSRVARLVLPGLEEVQQDYDANRRPSVRKLVSGGTTYALTQTGYDTRGRTDCVATRMKVLFEQMPNRR